MKTLHIVYCCDHRLASPICVSACAVISRLPLAADVHLHIFAVGWSDKHKDMVRSALNKTEVSFRLDFHTPDLHPYRSLPKFHGSHAAYTILSVAERLKGETVVYFDVDTLALCDISHLFLESIEDVCCAAVGWNEVAGNAHEKVLYAAADLAPETSLLNSGVMVIDCDRWISMEISERCIAFGEIYKDQIVGDQTLINLALRGRFKHLPWRFNTPLRPNDKAPPSLTNRILHFIGTPKPWDFLGVLYHNHRKVWLAEARRWQLSSLVWQIRT